MSPIMKKSFELNLLEILKNLKGGGKSLVDTFGSLSDEQWLWLFTDGFERNPEIRQVLPSLPEHKLQLQFTGASGTRTLKQAFRAYKLLKDIAARHGKTIERNSRVLDFGCGWGRLIRFFLKDVESSNLFGVDANPQVIKICEASNLRSLFQRIEPVPPTTFEDNVFDIIYSFSVFSHLPEKLHQNWLVEFKRLLKPGGLLLATTRPRSFIHWCAFLRMFIFLPVYYRGSARAFKNHRQALKDYDAGKFCFSTNDGSDPEISKPLFGQACISEDYVKQVWAESLEFVDFLKSSTHKQFGQNLIIVRKK